MPAPARIAVYVVITVGGLLGALWHYQESILYRPGIPNPENPMKEMQKPSDNPAGYRSPKEHDMDFEDLMLTAEDGTKINAWFMPGPAGPRTPFVIFAHENAGNMGLRLPDLKLLHGVKSKECR